MSLFVLDSDILSLLQSGEAEIAVRIAKRPTHEVAVSVITVEEQLRGWYTLVRRAKKPPQVARAYDRLARSVTFLSRMTVLSLSEAAIARFEVLRKAKLGVDGNDLRIAASALELDATVVTRNIRDFQRVPGLRVEDWSRS